MKAFEVSITGSGTQKEIIKSLKATLKDLEAADKKKFDGLETEDPTLCVEITETED